LNATTDTLAATKWVIDPIDSGVMFKVKLPDNKQCFKALYRVHILTILWCGLLLNKQLFLDFVIAICAGILDGQQMLKTTLCQKIYSGLHRS
jgi:hypothetical protein